MPVTFGEPLVLGTVRQRALLAVLALEAGHVVPLDGLIEALWGDDVARSAPLPTARHGR